MKQKLAILIPTIEGREWFLERLMNILNPQLEKYNGDVLHFILPDYPGQERLTIGAKRNLLTRMAIDAHCSHRSMIDDDDRVSDDYLDLNMPGVYDNYDCNSLVGIYSVNGVINPNKHIFLHSLKYDHWWEDEKYFYRNPNHLNVCSLAKIGHVKFPESNFGEDGQWSEKIHAEGCLRTEYEITKPFYYYESRTKPKEELERMKTFKTTNQGVQEAAINKAIEFHKKKYKR